MAAAPPMVLEKLIVVRHGKAATVRPILIEEGVMQINLLSKKLREKLHGIGGREMVVLTATYPACYQSAKLICGELLIKQPEEHAFLFSADSMELRSVTRAKNLIVKKGAEARVVIVFAGPHVSTGLIPAFASYALGLKNFKSSLECLGYGEGLLLDCNERKVEVIR